MCAALVAAARQAALDLRRGHGLLQHFDLGLHRLALAVHALQDGGDARHLLLQRLERFLHLMDWLASSC